jgi:beta-lactam-binding protein with PASTA domain
LSPTGQVVATPKVEGLALARAKSTLVSSGLTVGQVLKQCDPAAAGTVIHQFPTVGLFLLRGLKVDLVVSSGACRG